MALDLHIARLARILVDSEGITFDEAQARLRALTLEIVVGSDATSQAAHAAVMTAISVGRRTFLGGVRVVGALDQPLVTALPIPVPSLREAVEMLGGEILETPASRRIVVGTAGPQDGGWSVNAWWDGWRAGTAGPGKGARMVGDNPLAGIAAGALSVGAAFDAVREARSDVDTETNLWPEVAGGSEAPDFHEVFLPSSIWLVGIGNLGQAFLWALAALPYANPGDVSLVLQDRDHVSPENWATSVLVGDHNYGLLKTKVAEHWAMAKGFDVRRIDRRLVAADRLDDGDPRIALSGLDKIRPRKDLAQVGFDCVIDAGLGRTAKSFDTYRVTVFDNQRTIAAHFEDQDDPRVEDVIPDGDAYQRLVTEIGRCGTAEVAGAAVAAPYVSAVAATVAVSRLIAVTSGVQCPQNEVGKLSSGKPARIAPHIQVDARGSGHAGRPKSPVSEIDRST